MAREVGSRTGGVRQEPPKPPAGAGKYGAPPVGSEDSGTSGATVMGPRIAGMEPMPQAPTFGSEKTYPKRFNQPYEQVQLPIEKLERYVAGQQAMIGRMSPGSLSKLQADLAAVGLLGDYSDGAPDPRTLDAFGELLGIANQWGISWVATLDRMLAQTPAKRAQERGYTIDPTTGRAIPVREEFAAPPFQPNLPNKLDVDNVMRDASVNLLGQGWSQQNIDAASNAYIAEVTRLQRAEYDAIVARQRAEFEAGKPTSGGTIAHVEAPSAQNFAEEQIKKKNPQEVMTNQGMELLLGLIDQWGGGG